MPLIRHHFLIMKRLLLIALLVLAVVAVPSAALAQYPPTVGDLVLNKTIVEPGETVNVSGSGFCPNSQVTVRVKDNQGNVVATLGTFTTNSTGSFSGTVTVPSTLAPGRYTMESTGQSADCVATRVLSANFTVRAAAAAVAQGPLSATGADVLPWLIAALAVIVVGAGLWMYSRRRSVTQ